MIKNIMVCTDGSAYSDTACLYAIDLSKRLQARLLGLHVLDARALEGPLMADVANWVGAQPYGGQRFSFHKMMEEKGQAILDAFAAQARTAGLEPETIMTIGHPVAAILRQEGRAELLVAGRKGEHAEWNDEMLGSSIDRLVRRSTNPFLITPAEFQPINHIMAAYDGSGHAGRALQTAVGLSQALAVELSVVTIGEDNEANRNVIKEAGKRLKAYGVDIDPVLRPGKPETGIISEAAERGVDLIIAGTHGHGRIREMLLGGITHHLMASAKLPLLMVR